MNILDFVESHSDSTIYHTDEWRRVMQEAFGYRFYPVVVDCGNGVSGFVPLFRVTSWLTGSRLVAVPFRDRGGPLFNDPTSLGMLIERCKDLMQSTNCSSVVLKTVEPLPLDGVPNVEVRSPFLRSVLRLSSDVDEVWCRLNKSSARWGVKKATKLGVTARFGDGVADLERFYDLFFETRQRLGVPVFPFKLFRSIWMHMVPKFAQLIVAEYRGKVVAGAFFFFYKRRVTYAYAASRDEYLKFQPYNLLLWDAIRCGCERGFSEFDFGTTHRLQTGLLRFKSGWGTEHFPTFIYCLGDAMRLESASKGMERKMWNFLPKPLARKIGPWLTAHLG